MILIEETFENIQPEVVEEAAGKAKKIYLKGVLAEAEVKNRNLRTYDLQEMTREVMRVNEQAKLGNYVLGELDHPHTLDISLKNVSHKIVEMSMKGNSALGKVEILENHPNGQILKGLILDNVRVGFSTRASGKVNESTGRVSNFGLKTIDAVATPSCRSAFPETIEEQLQMYKRGELVMDLAEAVIHDKMAQKYFELEMKKFIGKLGYTKR